jgi:hypothetical protein
MSLQSSVERMGPTVTQIIHYVGGIRKTYHGIITNTIEQGQFTKFKCKDGKMILINDINVLAIEVFKEDNAGNII